MDISPLLDIHRQLLQQQELRPLLGRIVEHALALTGAERGYVVLAEGGRLRSETARDSCRGDFAPAELETSAPTVRAALARSAPRADGRADGRATNGRAASAGEDALGRGTPGADATGATAVSLEPPSVLCMPFEVTPALRGALYLDHREREGVFDERVERLCRVLANEAALAILQVKRLEEIRALGSVPMDRAQLAPACACAGDTLTLAQLEKRAILDALEKTGDDKRRAAALLGISRAKVYQRLKDWREGRA
jgi:transcriptional regulator with GAF, ATPase, and Fis domain